MALALGKRAGNTIGLPVRTVGTVLYGGLDAINTVVTLPKQSLEIVSNTTGQIKDVFSNAWNTGKRYNKLLNVPLSPFIATGTAIEGAVRAVVNPSWNAITHTRDVAGNTFVNVGNSIKSTLSDKPVSDFKYEHLKTSPIGTKNYVSKRQWFGNVGSKKTKELEKKVGELETSNKNLEAMIKQQETINKQQEETNKKLLETLSDLNKKQNTPVKKEDNGGKVIKLDPKKGEKSNPKKETKKLEIDENEEDYEGENQKIAA